jgi:hypothetical protein
MKSLIFEITADLYPAMKDDIDLFDRGGIGFLPVFG